MRDDSFLKVKLNLGIYAERYIRDVFVFTLCGRLCQSRVKDRANGFLIPNGEQPISRNEGP